MAAPSSARIVGAAMTALSRSQPLSAVELMAAALQSAACDAGLSLQDIDTLIALPSLMSEQHFMIGHAVAQAAQLTPRKGVLVRTLDVGGAGPVAALLAGTRAIQHEGRNCVAIVAGDTVGSAPLAEFLARADGSCSNSSSSSSSGGAGRVPSPVVPNLYDRVARWHMEQYGTTREQLAMCASLMTYQASFHPAAMHKRPRLLQEVLASPLVAPVTTKLECAKLADGAAALVLTRADRPGMDGSRAVAVLGGGEGSGPLSPPPELTEASFSAAEAAAAAYEEAGLGPQDVNYWGLYDCFPICLIRAVEAVGLAAKGRGGHYIQQQYTRLLGPLEQQHQQQQQQHGNAAAAASLRPDSHAPVWQVNTHGGLLGMGAPWEVPAMISLVEAVAQLRGEAAGRQVPGARTALVYGNGGVFSASAVAILRACRAAGRGGPGQPKSRL